MTSDDPFQRLLQDQIAPGLREAGFRPRGSKFTLERDGDWGMLHVQRHRFGTASWFVTANLEVSLAILRAWGPVPPADPDRPALGGGQWRTRIGLFLPAANDVWWLLVPDGALDAMIRSRPGFEPDVADFVRACVDVGAPTVLEHMQARILRDTWTGRPDPRLGAAATCLYAAVLTTHLGPRSDLPARVAAFEAAAEGTPWVSKVPALRRLAAEQV